MLPLERHRLIVELLGQHGVMRVDEIAQATRVSRETVRRDLSELERKGVLNRSHGGALLVENPLPTPRGLPSGLPIQDGQGSFQQRTLRHSEAKMRLGRKALQLLQPGDTILLDSSSTSWFMARQIPEMALTVITPSVAILQALMSRRSLHLIGLGGDFSPTEEAFFGEMTGRMLREYAIDTFFLLVSGAGARQRSVCRNGRSCRPGKANDDGSPSGRGADRQQQAGTAGGGKDRRSGRTGLLDNRSI